VDVDVNVWWPDKLLLMPHETWHGA